MELLNIYTTQQVLAKLLIIAGMFGLIGVVAFLFGWDAREKKEMIAKVIILPVLTLVFISMIWISSGMAHLRVYAYKVTDPWQVEEKLDSGFEIYDIDGIIYELSKKAPKGR